MKFFSTPVCRFWWYREPVCLSLMDEIVADSGGRGHKVARVSMYDIRKFEIGRDFPPGHKIVEVCILYIQRNMATLVDLVCLSSIIHGLAMLAVGARTAVDTAPCARMKIQLSGAALVQSWKDVSKTMSTTVSCPWSVYRSLTLCSFLDPFPWTVRLYMAMHKTARTEIPYSVHTRMHPSKTHVWTEERLAVTHGYTVGQVSKDAIETLVHGT